MDVRFSGIINYQGPKKNIREKIQVQGAAFRKSNRPFFAQLFDNKDRAIMMDGLDAAKFMAEEYGVKSRDDLDKAYLRMAIDRDGLFEKLDRFYTEAKLNGDAEGFPVREERV